MSRWWRSRSGVPTRTAWGSGALPRLPSASSAPAWQGAGQGSPPPWWPRVAPPGSLPMAARIRQRAHVSQAVPIVIFCVPTVAEGAEVEIAGNVYLTRPDNFDQLRALLHRLLTPPPGELKAGVERVVEDC